MYIVTRPCGDHAQSCLMCFQEFCATDFPELSSSSCGAPLRVWLNHCNPPPQPPIFVVVVFFRSFFYKIKTTLEPSLLTACRNLDMVGDDTMQELTDYYKRTVSIFFIPVYSSESGTYPDFLQSGKLHLVFLV